VTSATTALWVRAAALYGPIALAFAARLANGPRPRQFAACLLSFLWTMTSLLALQQLNAHAVWWSFAPVGLALHAMPLELYLGWTVLWGVLPQLAFPRTQLWLVAAIMAAVDVVAMPLCGTAVQLGPRWLEGEAFAIALVLLPALCLARWTMENRRLHLRAAMQIALAGMLFLDWIPELVFALRPGPGWMPLRTMSAWRRQLTLSTICALALPGVAAVMEFAQRGRGTPIPYDPPKRLVTSGVYRYCANPMQLSCALVMLVWAAVLRNVWLLIPVAISAIYSAGIAEWDERADLTARFGADWLEYRTHVKNWRLRWRPCTLAPVARVYIARTCGPCSEVRQWLEAREPLDLQIVDAEALPQGSITRMRYVAGDDSETVEGVRAMARALEHVNFGYAMLGAAMRLPGVWHLTQLALDASGLGPRAIACEVSIAAHHDERA